MSLIGQLLSVHPCILSVEYFLDRIFIEVSLAYTFADHMLYNCSYSDVEVGHVKVAIFLHETIELLMWLTYFRVSWMQLFTCRWRIDVVC